MKILGIETSCDETAAAIVEDKGGKFSIRSNLIASQAAIHAGTGGVVPERASREHVKNILPIIDGAFRRSRLTPSTIDAIAVTGGPGLITSLLVGIEAAKTLSYVWQKPLIVMNHLAGHLYANFLEHSRVAFPLLALIVSGGHTELVYMPRHRDYQLLGQTRDDAAGEAFDKVAKLLNLGYPGGPAISKLARQSDRRAFRLPRPMIHARNFDFSFSGLKTAVLYETMKTPKRFRKKKTLRDLCASFEQAVVDVLVEKTVRAVTKYKVKSVLLAGGVAANETLRTELRERLASLPSRPAFFFPSSLLCTDNAAMIAGGAIFAARQEDFTPWENVEVRPNWNLA